MPSYISAQNGSCVHSPIAGTTSRCPSTATISSPAPYSANPIRLSRFSVLNPNSSACFSASSSANLGPSPKGASLEGSPFTLCICTLLLIPSSICFSVCSRYWSIRLFISRFIFCSFIRTCQCHDLIACHINDECDNHGVDRRRSPRNHVCDSPS